MLLVGSSIAYADPRMETTDNFCHFIHNNINADDESFVADCGSVISVNDPDGVAQGFALVTIKNVPLDFDEITAELSHKRRGRKIVITNETFQGDLDCAMVDSNGTQYNSRNWVNTISFRKKSRHSRTGTLTYRLRCIDGEAN